MCEALQLQGLCKVVRRFCWSMASFCSASLTIPLLIDHGLCNLPARREHEELLCWAAAR